MEHLKEWFNAKDHRHLPVFIALISLIIGFTIALTLAANNTGGGQSGAYKNKCLPPPKCIKDGKCPELLNYKIPNTNWCLPSPSPTASGCYYQQTVCPAIACVKGQPCPTCPPPKLICPSPSPIPTPLKCGNLTCNSGQRCGLMGCPSPFPGQQPPYPSCNPTYVCINPSPSPTPTPIIPVKTGCIPSPAYNGDLCGPIGYRLIAWLNASATCYSSLAQCYQLQTPYNDGTCVQSPTYFGDVCKGYRWMSGISRSCYTLQQCMTVLSATPSAMPTPTPKPSQIPTPSPY